jgi:phosphoenolpyruvate synthase/pyruvate phosphate dikinase
VDEPRFGAKSANLGELLAAGIPVPDGFAVSVEAFDEFMRESGLVGAVEHALSRVSGPRDVDGIGTAARTIGEAMRSAAVPAEIAEEIGAAYAALGSDLPVAVRSSAIGEDTAEATFAGQQETYLWIHGAGAVCDAVRDCWASLFGAPAISYRLGLGESPAAARMGVGVQTMVDAAVSGVMFTCNPVSGDPSMVSINASWGLGLAVVGGEVTPDDYLVSKVTGEVVAEHVHSKTVEYVHVPGGGGAVRIDVPAERATTPCVDAPQLAALLDLARRVQRHFGSHQDIEWAIDRDGRLFVLQARPVTAAGRPEPKPAPADALSMVMKTFGVR